MPQTGIEQLKKERPVRARLGPAPDTMAPPAGRWAVLVCHGMGQQVPFETLQQVAGILSDAEARATQTDPKPIGVTRVTFGDFDLPRAEVTVSVGKARAAREVHVYETYWAPLTEGKISIRQTIKFLFSSGWAGIRSSAGAGKFLRWMFGQWNALAVSPGTSFRFFMTLAVLGALILLNAAVTAVIGAQMVNGGGSPWPSKTMIADLTVDLLLTAAVAGAGLFLGIGVPRLWRKALKPGARKELPGAARFSCWAMVLLGMAALLAGGVVVGAHLWQHRSGQEERLLQFGWTEWVSGQVEDESTPIRQAALLLLAWGGILGISVYIRGFLVQYVGDVAIYLTSHKVSEFHEVREGIQKVALRTANAIYGATAGTAGPRLYDQVIVVGHSLGSVIAYDTLNQVVRCDEIAPPAEQCGAKERTPLLLTFGSPLDKVAFIYRTQRKDRSDLREVAAAVTRPLILDYQYRPPRWVNLHSGNDVISGSLEYYDLLDEKKKGKKKREPAPEVPPHYRGRCVDNKDDLEASTPLAAHTEFWENRMLADELYAAATAEVSGSGFADAPSGRTS